jgi:hypothetical protein
MQPISSGYPEYVPESFDNDFIDWERDLMLNISEKKK